MQLFEEKHSETFNNRLFVFAFALLFLLVLLRTAWISDDAAITLRTVLNFTHGFGPTFNIDERVQAYTHPLWFFILSLGSLISGNVFYTTFFISIAFTMGALGLLLSSISRNHFSLVLIGLAVILSKSFVDFSTSGLENPLSHLLLLLAVLFASSHIENGRDRLTIFFLICSGIYLNRPDLLVMALPLAIYVTFLATHHPKQLAAKLLIAASPVIIWTTFSLFYYGFPFPNTAYAKLGTGIEMDERVVQGLKYLLHSIDRDPVTIFVIVTGLTIGLYGSRLSKSLSTGVALYLMYVLYIGGDFMEGRFLTAPFFMSLIIFAREVTTKSLAVVLMIPVVVLGSASIHPNLLAGSSYSNTKIQDSGIADERGFYYQNFGLLAAKRNTFTPPKWHASDRKVEVICGGLGFNSIMNGPGMHYIDNCALADPLLARLPAKENPNWRIGHFIRQIPTDYKKSLEQGKNLLVDQKTARYWESIRTVTRGALFDKDRFVEIARLNLGLVEQPDREMYRTKNIPRSKSIPEITESDVKTIRAEGSPWDATGNFIFDNALDIVLSNIADIKSIDVSLDNNDIYELAGLRNDEWIFLATVGPRNTSGLARYKITLDSPVIGIEKIRVTAKSGDGMYSIGHLVANAE